MQSMEPHLLPPLGRERKEFKTDEEYAAAWEDHRVKQTAIDSEASALKVAAVLFLRDLQNRTDHPGTKAVCAAALTHLAPPPAEPKA